MADVFTIEKRSSIMSKIGGKNTKQELLVRRYLFSNGFRYRINDKRLPGKPDIYLPKYKTVIFINGCFWHGHINCKAATLPTSNVDYWTRKIATNIQRDNNVKEELQHLGYKVIIVWQCQLKPKIMGNTLLNLIKEIKDIDSQ